MMAAPIPIRQPRYYTPLEVAEELKVSVWIVRRLMNAGKIGYVEASPKRRRIPCEALDRFDRKELQRNGQASW